MLPGAVLPTKHRLGLYAVDAGNRHARQIRGAGAGSTVEGSAPLAYVSEDAPWGGRCYSCLAPGSRPTTLTYHAGPARLGQILFKHRKGCTNGQNQWIAQGDGGPVRIPCCCFLPYLDTLDAHDQKLGRSEHACDACLFVPKYRVLGPAGEAWYAVRPDTCACGMCVECRCGGRGAKLQGAVLRAPPGDEGKARRRKRGLRRPLGRLGRGDVHEARPLRDEVPRRGHVRAEVHAAGLRAPHRPHRQRAGGATDLPSPDAS